MGPCCRVVKPQDGAGFGEISWFGVVLAVGTGTRDPIVIVALKYAPSRQACGGSDAARKMPLHSAVRLSRRAFRIHSGSRVRIEARASGLVSTGSFRSATVAAPSQLAGRGSLAATVRYHLCLRLARVPKWRCRRVRDAPDRPSSRKNRCAGMPAMKFSGKLRNR